MTIDEQIKIFESNAEFVRRDGDLQGCLNFRKLAEWLKDYKRLLEQQPCDDCISRKQAIELFVGWWSDLLEYHKEDECFDALLKALPPVTPQQKMGQWIVEAGDRETGYGGCTMCSECAGEGNTEMDYCPNCGAKMTESEDEE